MSQSMQALVLEFNLAPANYVDPSWLPVETSVVFAAVAAGFGKRALDVVSRWLLSEHALQDAFDFDFSEPLKRIALVDRASLQHLARHLGLLAVAKALRTTIDRVSVGALKARLGAQNYEFALRHGTAANVLAAPARVDLSCPRLEDRLLAVGGQRLLSFFESAPPALVGRARLKLPRTLSPRDEDRLPSNARDRAPDVLLKTILPEVLPQWRWLF
jgi:hypothetical protein